MLYETLEYISQNQQKYINAIIRHISIDGVSLSICILIAIPLGYLCAKKPKFATPILNLTSIIRIIPSIAIFIILLPIMGIGVVPAVIALVAMSIPTVLLNTMSGIRGVDPLIIESAEGMGMGNFQIAYSVELPLAMPMILSGVRTATIEVVAGTTIASYIGAGGLGDFIVSGLSQYRNDVMLTGALTVAIISIALDILLSVLQRRSLRRVK